MDKTISKRHVTLNTVATFSRPVSAQFKGEPVRVSAIGDVDGQSASYMITDESGLSGWVPQGEVTLTDSDYLPSGRALSTAGVSSGS